jgi:hypothetical protein
MSAKCDENAVVDLEMVPKAVQAEAEVRKEMPSERDAEMLAREVFVATLAQHGDPAKRPTVERAWKLACAAVEVYLKHRGEVKGLYDLQFQRNIRKKVILT